MARRMAANVAVTEPETGNPRVFVAGEEPPGWAADQLTNPDVWESGDDADTGATGGGPVEPDVPDLEVPPRHGKGSGRDAWAAHAAALGVDVNDDMSRDDIIELLEQRG